MYQSEDTLPVRNISGFHLDSTLFQNGDDVDAVKPVNENETNAAPNEEMTTDLDEVVVDSGAVAANGKDNSGFKEDDASPATENANTEPDVPNFDPPPPESEVE